MSSDIWLESAVNCAKICAFQALDVYGPLIYKKGLSFFT